jgi:hypothetical protein
MELGQSQITQVRMPNGQTISIVDWTDKPLFSTMDLLSGYTDQNVECFTYTVSDNVSSSNNVTTRRVATEADTNVVTPGGMASTEEILIYNIKVEPYQLNDGSSPVGDASLWSYLAPGLPIPAPEPLAILGANTLLRLEISQKIYAEAGLTYFNTGFGIFTAGARGVGTAGAIGAYASLGLPSAEAPRSFSIPHHIGGQEKFRVVLVNPTGAAVDFTNPSGAADPKIAIRLRVLLEGLYKRPVS